jgi:hypothetical protein
VIVELHLLVETIVGRVVYATKVEAPLYGRQHAISLTVKGAQSGVIRMLNGDSLRQVHALPFIKSVAILMHNVLIVLLNVSDPSTKILGSIRLIFIFKLFFSYLHLMYAA